MKKDNLSKYCDDFFKRHTLDCGSAIDKRCLSASIARFLDSGKKEDAFDVYFAFAEIFKVFGEGYGENTKHLLELICEYEMSAGTLVEKQRDHYAHSVFVFAIGLAVYVQSSKYRKYFNQKTKRTSHNINEEFLYRWGLTSLFHDIGYPFEIVFEQIKTYTKGINKDGEYYPFLTYKALDKFVNCNEINIHLEFAEEINKKLGIDFKTVYAAIDELIEKSDEYMDHGYFGGVMMYNNLIERNDIDLCRDVATGIMLHNSFLVWKLRKQFVKKLSPKDYPLAFLLMLCDELQDYGREGFGKISKKDNLAYTAEFSISKDEFNIKYIFDENGSGKAEARIKNKIAKMQFYDMDSLFSRMKISYEIRDYDKPITIFMSSNFFKNIQKIAMQIHAFYLNDKRDDIQIKTWNDLTLEYKLSNIAQAKSYAEKLNKFGYFYDDRNLHYQIVSEFTDKQIEKLAIDEHARWIKEKIEMGWELGFPKDRAEREEKRVNPCLIPYSKLSENEKEKDRDTIRHLIENLNSAGFKVYRVF